MFSQHVPGISFARYADLVGLIGIRVERSEDVVRRGMKRWQQRGGVLDVQVDPEVPTLRHTSTFGAARNSCRGLIRPNAPTCEGLD